MFSPARFLFFVVFVNACLCFLTVYLFFILGDSFLPPLFRPNAGHCARQSFFLSCIQRPEYFRAILVW